MHMTANDRRCHQEFEDAREAAETETSTGVDCCACKESAETEAVTLMGLVYCADCGADEAFRLRATGDDWAALTQHDQAEALEIIETQAHLERAQIVPRPL